MWPLKKSSVSVSVYFRPKKGTLANCYAHCVSIIMCPTKVGGQQLFIKVKCSASCSICTPCSKREREREGERERERERERNREEVGVLRRVQIIHFILWTKSDKIINANMSVVVRVCVCVFV